MPLIAVRYASTQTVSKAAIAEAASSLAATILHKDPSVTAVIVEATDPANWFAGGRSLEDQGLASYWLDIRIVDGTNTKDEKAAFIAAVYARMAELLGPLHPESYAHVNDVRAEAYGFGGVTQERRYIARKLGVSLSSEAG